MLSVTASIQVTLRYNPRDLSSEKPPNIILQHLLDRFVQRQHFTGSDYRGSSV